MNKQELGNEEVRQEEKKTKKKKKNILINMWCISYWNWILYRL